MVKHVDDIRNIAIIAHVDHGKTTLVDELLKQSGAFRENQVVAERIMDSNDLERERGITILSKNASVRYKGVKINIIDTPGHADFGGEVERALKMADGVALVVDAFEGSMPQTRFVLKVALLLDLPVIVCINKIDRPEARPTEVEEEILELFMDLDATDEQLDFPVVYTSAKLGVSFVNESDDKKGMESLFKAIIENIPPPKGDVDADGQMLVSAIDYNDYVGRIGVGKIENGALRVNEEAMVVNASRPGEVKKAKINGLFEFEGLERVPVKNASVGSIVAISGIDDLSVGDTVCFGQKFEPLPFTKISEPTISMNFLVNDSPFSGKEGKFVTGRNLRERLFKELNTDVSLRVEETESFETFKVSGRGELHLSILIENMRREGYEFQVSKPEALLRDVNGALYEPFEIVTVDAADEFSGVIIEKLSARKGELVNMLSGRGGMTRLVFNMPSRGLIGYRNEFLTDSKGSGALNAVFDDYKPYKGAMPRRAQGSLIAFETGEAMAYGLYNAQERGELFISPGVKVYSGMVVGRNARGDDMEVNVCKRKQLTNMRSAGADDALRLTPATIFSLEQTLEFIKTDELVEVTPLSLRIRKKTLDSTMRKRLAIKK
ncbi:MAG: translational GTPase TypA [Clostridiales bacterium]|jgi:GTP-binding protein|nr:translational GTPase TypA [Clostridiales bacterium]